MSKFLFTFGIIVFGLSLGYGIQDLARREILRLPIPLGQLRKLLQKVSLLVINPFPVIGALWVMRIRDVRIATLPFLGMAALLLGGFLALKTSRWLQLGRRQIGAFYACGSFTNLLSIGALICFVFLGEAAFALVLIYRLFEDLVYYVVGFPIARAYGSHVEEKEALGTRLKRLAFDPFVLVSVTSLSIATLLNLSGLKRPEYYKTFNTILIPFSVTLLLISIGLAVRVSRIRHYLKECLVVSAIKFLIVPTVITSTGLLLGYGRIGDGLPLKVVLILSSMPVAFTALVPPSIYDLDLDLANSCWLFTTALLVIVVPILFFLINLF
jgi:hypothetical protein